ncbi:5-bromo-4-chloroindolyl phosphate hydrolysis family protein [Tateyamaria sp.]|nr:5-bromo-4-chloroindolyl phosphate hydrolysis family protein [Tateyamaria sp.]
MAQKLDGEFSPRAKPAPSDPAKHIKFEQPKVDPVGARANMLFIPAIPMLFMALNDGAVTMFIALIATAVLTLAAWLLRGGLQAEAAFANRKTAQRPAIPRKIFASILTGLGISFAAYKTEPELLASILYGTTALSLHIAAFGSDPLKSKGLEGKNTFQRERVARTVDKAETYLKEMSDVILILSDHQLEVQLKNFQSVACELIRAVEEDPRDLIAARKYLSVYLKSAHEATSKFGSIYNRTRDEKVRDDYAALLEDLHQSFTAINQKLLLEDQSELNLEIDVLRDRLQR